MPQIRPALFDRLEPRQLLAGVPDLSGTTGQVTDADGDIIRFKITGPGSAEVFLEPGGGIHGIALVGSTDQTKLAISVTKRPGGDGFTSMSYIEAVEGLGILAAPKVDLSGGFVAADAFSVTLGSLSAGADLQLDSGPSGSMRIAIRSISGGPGDSSVIDVGSRTITSLTMEQMKRGEVHAANIGTWRVVKTSAALTGRLTSVDVTLSGRLERLQAGEYIDGCAFTVGNSIGTILAGALSGVGITASGFGPAARSIDTIRVGFMDSVNINATGPVGLISTANWEGGSLVADSFGKLLVNGAPRLAVPGDLNAPITLTGTPDHLGFQRLYVRQYLWSNVVSFASVGDIDVGGVQGAKVAIGLGSGPLTDALPAGFTDFDVPLASIRSFTLSRRLGSSLTFAGGQIMAPVIQKLTMFNTNANSSFGGVEYGVLTTQIGVLSLATPRVRLRDVTASGLAILPPEQLPLPVDFQASYADIPLGGSVSPLDGRIRLNFSII